MIEILSPDQKSTKVISNILHCLQHGSKLGWMLDPDDRAILVFQPKQELIIYRDGECLPVLADIELELSPDRIFSGLKMRS